MNKKIRKFILKVLVSSILFVNFPVNSLANTLSDDNRYETFEGSNIIVDNVLEENAVNIEVEGNTLVNLFSNISTVGGGLPLLTKEGNKYTSTNRLEGSNVFNINYRYKPSVITAIFNYNTNSSQTLNIGRYESDGIYRQICSIQEGLNIVKLDLNLYPNMLSLYVGALGAVDVTTSHTITDIIILEGDLTNKEIPEYFEGMKSVGQNDNKNNIGITSSVGNPNLIKNSGFLNGFNGYNTHNSPEITVLDDSSSKSGKILKVKTGTSSWSGAWQTNIVSQVENKKYVLSGWIKGDINTTVNVALERHKSQNITFLDNSWVKFEIISDLNPTTWNRTITFYGLNSSSTFYIKDIKVEEYHEATPYIPHIDEINYNDFQYTDKKEFELKEPLRALPTGVKDKIINKNGQLVIERQLKERIINGQESGWIKAVHELLEGKDEYIFNMFLNDCKSIDATKRNSLSDRYADRTNGQWANEGEGIWVASNCYLNIRISKSKLPENATVQDFRNYLSNNPVKILYQLENPIYEPLGVELIVPIYKNYTNLFNNSKIPASMKIVVDRVVNRAKEFTEIAKDNPTIENISQARYWVNLMNDSILKDEFQCELNDVLEMEDLEIDKKILSVNTDIYIKMANTLSMSLDTNSISFKGYTGSEDLEILEALNITVDSSLPYNLNVYMPTGIYNSDKTKNINMNVLNVKESTEETYKQFTSINDKLVLKENCEEGENKTHSIDLKLSGNTHKADIYKTVLKFEAEQK